MVRKVRNKLPKGGGLTLGKLITDTGFHPFFITTTQQRKTLEIEIPLLAYDLGIAPLLRVPLANYKLIIISAVIPLTTTPCGFLGTSVQKKSTLSF